jgi:hypothetical protein
MSVSAVDLVAIAATDIQGTTQAMSRGGPGDDAGHLRDGCGSERHRPCGRGCSHHAATRGVGQRYQPKLNSQVLETFRSGRSSGDRLMLRMDWLRRLDTGGCSRGLPDAVRQHQGTIPAWMSCYVNGMAIDYRESRCGECIER